MSYVSVDSALIQRVLRNCSETISRIEKTKQNLTSSYQSLGATWSDSKYQHLGTIINDCTAAINKASGELQNCVQNLELINVHIQEYESVNFIGNSAGAANSSDTGLFGLSGASSNQSQNSSSGETGSLNQILNAPRSLSATQQRWYPHNNNSSAVFNTPVETGRMLDANQGKYEDFAGTCGLVSCVNVLRMAGMRIAEADVVSYASSNRNAEGDAYLCTVNSNPSSNGGTHQYDRQEILSHFGLESNLQTSNIENISTAVREGRGVIISVDAGRFWNDPRYIGGGHAVTVTSVQVDNNGDVEGFYICDSGTQGRDEARYVSANHLQNSLNRNREINVTSIIR